MVRYASSANAIVGVFFVQQKAERLNATSLAYYDIMYVDLKEGFAGIAKPTELAPLFNLKAANPATKPAATEAAAQKTPVFHTQKQSTSVRKPTWTRSADG